MGRQINYQEFSTDRQQVVAGVNLEAAKVAFADAFVKRAEFVQRYNGAITADSFVDALIQNVKQSSNVDLSAQRSGLVERYKAGTSMEEGRSLAVRAAIEADSFRAAEGLVAQIAAEAIPLLVLMRDQKEKASVPHPQLAAL